MSYGINPNFGCTHVHICFLCPVAVRYKRITAVNIFCIFLNHKHTVQETHIDREGKFCSEFCTRIKWEFTCVSIDPTTWSNHVRTLAAMFHYLHLKDASLQMKMRRIGKCEKVKTETDGLRKEKDVESMSMPCIFFFFHETHPTIQSIILSANRYLLSQPILLSQYEV